ncbi:proton-conducting transporter membrane subunit [Natroniella sp. ANB-PHB2]|uniref:proton-conducting transporter transmembrane domain-containing protein n=1 Tax=Natroniella sp. ANB-PHB2 TaxID=3384444 RepID=UPI0038D44FCF
MVNPGFIYLLGAVILYFTKGKLRDFLAVMISAIGLLWIYNLPVGEGMKVAFLDLDLILVNVNNISRLVGVVFAFFGLCTMIYSLVFSDKKFYVLSHIYVGGSLAVLFAGDLFSFYFFWEVMTISSYFLIFDRTKPITEQTSYYYFLMHLVGGVSLLWGVLMNYSITGSILLRTVEYGLPFFILAVAIKLAFVGFHTWLPRNYSNVPFHISVLLSAYTTKVGVYALYRLLGAVSVQYAGVVTAIVGVLFALQQTEVRKLLSYHIVSQIGYMIVGIGVRNSYGIAGGMLHLTNNILYKGLLFMVIGTVIYSTDKEDLIDLGGLSKKLPITTFCGVIASLAIAGAPFLSGHVSKILIKNASSDPILVWGLFVAGIGTTLSFLKVMYFGFFRKREVEVKRKPNKLMLGSMLFVAGTIIAVGLMPNVITDLFNLGVQADYFSLSYMWKSLQPMLLALIIFKLAHDIIEPHEHDHVDRDIYPVIGYGINYVGGVLSKVQNGDVSRYILWLLTTLAIVWVSFLV